MEKYTLKTEIVILKSMIDQKCQRFKNLCSLDVDALNEVWINDQLLENVRCSFLPLMREMFDIEHLPRLIFDFIDESVDTQNHVSIVSLRGTYFLMKMEEYKRTTDWSLHEYFVGIHLKNMITFSAVLGAYSCTPAVENVSRACSYAGDVSENVNFVLYQYIDGKNLYEMINSETITINDTWNILKIVWESVKEMHKINGFVHQDLHFGNIMVLPMEKVYRISVGDKKFDTRYIPKIIDYGRSLIVVDGITFSPKEDYFKIPATSVVHDLRYLLRSFTYRFQDYSAFSDPAVEDDDPLFYFFSLSDNDIINIYNHYDKKYYRPEKGSEEIIQAKYTTVKYPNCRKMNYPDDKLSPLYRSKVKYYNAERRTTQLTEEMRKAYSIGKYNSIESLMEYLDLMMENNFIININEFGAYYNSFYHHYPKLDDQGKRNLLDKMLLYVYTVTNNPANEIDFVDILEELKDDVPDNYDAPV